MKKAELNSPLVTIGLLLLVFAGIMTYFAVDSFAYWLDGVINDPNRPTNEYDVTCRFALKTLLGNPQLINTASTQQELKDYTPPNCAVKKSKLFSIGAIFGYDEGNVRLSSLNINPIYEGYRLEWLADFKTYELTLRKVPIGYRTFTIDVLDDSGFSIDSTSISIQVGDV